MYLSLSLSNDFKIELLRHPEFVGYLLAQRIHIAAYFIVRDFGVYLGSGDMLVP